MSAAIVAFGALSGLGEGWDAASAGQVGAPAEVAIARDGELEGYGFAKPFASRARLGEDDGGEPIDRATRIFAASFAACARSLDATRPGWRASRVGLAIGTSSGGMRTAELFFARVAGQVEVDAAFAARAAYFGPLLDVIATSRVTFAPASLVLCACASSAVAIGLASRWLAQSACDIALAGGFDGLGAFVASGFESLQATSAKVPPRPFRVGRDGMALGEGGAVVALVREAEGMTAAGEVLGYVRGFGASADAVHLTAPDRHGGGVLRAARAAMLDAGVTEVDLVSAHATATPFNDAAESRALAAIGGSPVVHALKAQVGHTLGAAGALESLAALDAIRRGVLPATAGDGVMDPEAPARLLARTERGAPKVALKLASAFGGANAALVVASEPGRDAPRPVHDAWVTRAAHVGVTPDPVVLAEALAIPVDRLARADRHVLWALSAIHALRERIGRDALTGAGIIVGTAVATLETNAAFAAPLRQRGPRSVAPRLFPYTSPNAVAGECGIAFGLTGPSFSVGAGLCAGLEALAVAFTLVRAGDAERIVVVAVDDLGDVARAWTEALDAELRPGAVALLVTRDRASHAGLRITSARHEIGAFTSSAASASHGPWGHLALAPLDSDAPPAYLEASSSLLGTLAVARVDFSAN